MNIITIISLIAGSLTLIGFIYASYRYIKKIINRLSNRIESIELSLKTKQRFLIPKDTKVIINENETIIKLDDDETIIVDKIENNIVYGKIFYNTVYIRLSINDLGEEKI